MKYKNGGNVGVSKKGIISWEGKKYRINKKALCALRDEWDGSLIDGRECFVTVLSKKVRVGTTSVSNWLSTDEESYYPTKAHLVRIAEVTGKEMSYFLLSLDEEVNNESCAANKANMPNANSMKGIILLIKDIISEMGVIIKLKRFVYGIYLIFLIDSVFYLQNKVCNGEKIPGLFFMMFFLVNGAYLIFKGSHKGEKRIGYEAALLSVLCCFV